MKEIQKKINLKNMLLGLLLFSMIGVMYDDECNEMTGVTLTIPTPFIRYYSQTGMSDLTLNDLHGISYIKEFLYELSNTHNPIFGILGMAAAVAAGTLFSRAFLQRSWKRSEHIVPVLYVFMLTICLTILELIINCPISCFWSLLPLSLAGIAGIEKIRTIRSSRK